jgi:hypothetical protein
MNPSSRPAIDSHHKSAYRYLLYRAMLDIRPIAWQPSNPLAWMRHKRRARELGELANWLHNMAFFSHRDFQNFDEQIFWREFDRLRIAHPELARYRDHFETALRKSETGR